MTFISSSQSYPPMAAWIASAVSCYV
jgi:hypothetical protein